MKIMSWNINGARSSANKLRTLIQTEQPDVLLLQEIKCQSGELRGLLAADLPDYTIFVSDSYRAGHFGVATLIRTSLIKDEYGDFKDTFEVVTSPIDYVIDGKQEGRLLATVIDGMLILNTYTVNVRRDLSRLKEREGYDNHVMALVEGFRQHRGVTSVIYMGDLNVVPEAIDYHGNEIRPKTAGMTRMERVKYQEFLTRLDLVDSYRAKYPRAVRFTYFSFIGDARTTGKGWRIDLALVSRDLIDKIVEVDILEDVLGSDHVPIYLTLQD